MSYVTCIAVSVCHGQIRQSPGQSPCLRESLTDRAGGTGLEQP